MYVQTC